MTHTNNPTEQQATPTSEGELREELRGLSRVPSHYCNCDACHKHMVFRDDDLMALLTSEIEKAKLEARLQEHEMLQHQARVNLKSAEAIAQWSEIRVNNLVGNSVRPDDVVNIIKNIDDDHVQIKRLLGNFVIDCLVSDDMVRAVEAYINKRVEKAEASARLEEHIMVRDEWASPGIAYSKTIWSLERIEELSKLQEKQDE